MTFGTYTNSNMRNSVTMLIFSVLDLKYLFRKMFPTLSKFLVKLFDLIIASSSFGKLVKIPQCFGSAKLPVGNKQTN